MIAALALASISLSASTPAPRPWPDRPFEPVTLARVEALPAGDQVAWRAYLDASANRARLMPARTAPEFSPLKPLEGPPKGGAHTIGLALGRPAKWYAAPEARAIADRIVAAQSAAGAWAKGNNYTTDATGPQHDPGDAWSSGTFDNDATIRELQFLARVITATTGKSPADAWRTSFLRGLDYCFAAQYPNGGFPQIYPLAGGYHDAITYNDNAMGNVLRLLRDVAAGQGDYRFVPAEVRAQAGRSFQRGIDCILATQLKSPTGELTAWCQQHDALTLAACSARNFEPAAVCTSESSELLELLMELPEPSPRVSAAVKAGVAWLERTSLRDVRWTHGPAGTGLAAAPGAPRLWARLYELDTNTPVFGDRDRTIHYAVTELSRERQLGYAWYGTWPEPALAKYQTWQTRAAK